MMLNCIIDCRPIDILNNLFVKHFSAHKYMSCGICAIWTQPYRGFAFLEEKSHEDTVSRGAVSEDSLPRPWHTVRQKQK